MKPDPEDRPRDAAEEEIAREIREERHSDPDFADPSYIDWFVAVNLHVFRKTELRALDFPDWDFASAFGDGMSASAAATALLEDIGGAFAGAGTP